MMNYLARESLVSRWATTLLYLEGLGKATVVGHCDFHADIRDTGGSHISGVGCTDKDIIQISQNHHQVLTGCRHAIRTTPVFLRNSTTVAILMQQEKMSICLPSSRYIRSPEVRFSHRLLQQMLADTPLFTMLLCCSEPLTSLKITSNCSFFLLLSSLLFQDIPATRVMSLPYRSNTNRWVNATKTHNYEIKTMSQHEGILTIICTSGSPLSNPLWSAT